MKRLFKTFSIFCLACVLLSACSQQPPDTAPVQEPVQDGAVEEAPVYVYLTRHGQTLTNQTGRFVSGRGNTPLTEEGRKVAYAVGLGLSGVKFEAAYASTLGRTQETARIILSQSQTSRYLEIIPVEDLKEVDGGSYEPMSYAELMTDEGMQFSGVTTEEFTNQFHEKDPEGLAESYEQMKDRAFESFQRICEERAQNGGGNILMVAHGGINSMIAAEIMQEQELEPLDNSSIVLIEYKDHKIKDLFLDIAAEELGHMEMVAQTINLLNGHDVDADQVKAGEIQSHVILGLNPGLINASGYSWTGDYVTVTGDLCADLLSNIASEQRAKVVYEYLYRQIDDKKVRETIDFLLNREEAHNQMFRDAFNEVQDSGSNRDFGTTKAAKMYFSLSNPGPNTFAGNEVSAPKFD